MNVSGFRLRRATSEDVPQLVKLWTAAQLPAGKLEKKFTEFQIAEDDQGQLAGALGLEISGKHGLLHSETIPDFAQADTLRPRLWERIEKVVQNHGLVRLWTRESAPFWREHDFVPTDPSLVASWPAAFGEGSNTLTRKLKDDVSIDSLVDDEFAQWRQVQAKEREKTMRRARTFKLAGVIFTMVFAVILMICFIFFIRYRQQHGK